MSTITYKCNVCKREITKLENAKGLTVFSKCIITEGCRGNLYKIFSDPNNIRESFPSVMDGVDDYFPRKTFYEHIQGVEAKEWKVFHNLSVSPSISVFEETDLEVRELKRDAYTVIINDKNSLTIKFVTAKRGIVHCIARTSVPTKPKLITPLSNSIQVTSDSTIAFAVPEVITKTSNPDQPIPYNTADTTVVIELEAIKPNEEPILCFEELDGDIVGTAWLGWDRILVRNRRHYNIKTKSLNDFRTFSDIQTNLQEIPNGTIIRFLRIDYGDGVFQPIPSRGLFILLSNPPYASADKVRNKLIDVGEMIKTKYEIFSLNDEELYVNEKNEEFTYPEIKNAPGKTTIQFVTPTPLFTGLPFPSPTPTPTMTQTPTPSDGAMLTVTPTPTMTQTPTPS